MFTKPVLSRMYFISPEHRDRFYLRLLPSHVKGAKSFENLKSYEGIVYDTYLDAAKAKSLINSNKVFEK